MKFRRLLFTPELVGIVIGAFILFTWGFQMAMLNTPAWLLLTIATLSSVAAFVTGVGSLSQDFDSHSSIRRGVASAGLAACVAACAFALMTCGIPGTPQNFKALFAGALSVLPAMFCGLFSSIAAVILTTPPANAHHVHAPPQLQAKLPEVWGLRLVIGLLFVAAVVAPFVRQVALPVARPSEKPVAKKLPVPFTYQVPPGMSRAHAMQWRLASARRFSDATPGTIALSQDDRWLAHGSQTDQALAMYDLHNSGNDYRIPISHSLGRLSFSPAGDRLFALTGGNSPEIVVIDLATRESILLPKPKHRAIPQGQLLWWHEKEVLIASIRGDLFALNLDSLEVDDANAVSFWREAEPVLKEKVLQELVGSSGDSQHWAWKAGLLVENTSLPEIQGLSYWPVTISKHLAITHPEHDCSQLFPTITAEPNDVFRMSKDGCKVLRQRGSQIDVMYFKAGEAPYLKWEFLMPHTIQECPKSARVEAALEDGSLCALIYGPMTNPLTGKVVGPDRNTVRGLVRINYWLNKTATVHLAARYSEIRPGDVIADLSIWDEQPPELLNLSTLHRWWTVLPEPLSGSDRLTTIPPPRAQGSHGVYEQESGPKRLRSTSLDRQFNNKL